MHSNNQQHSQKIWQLIWQLSIALFGCSALLYCLPAAAIFKCTQGKEVLYTDAGASACAKHMKIETPQLPGTPSAQETRRAQQRAALEKKQLQQIEQNHTRLEHAQAAGRIKIQRTQATQNKKCRKLALREQWAMHDLTNATHKTSARYKNKLKHAQENFQLECA